DSNPAAMGNIHGSFDSVTGVLTLSSPGATATTSQWQAALRAVTYTNLSQSPGTATRSVSFTVSDHQAPGLPLTRMINVASINDTPLATAQSFTTSEDTAKAITLVGSDVDSSALNYHITAPPQHGSLTGTGPNLTYIPAANYSGTDSFRFRVGDGETFSNIVTVNISVEELNDQPTLSALPDLQISENADTRVILLSGISMGASNESQTLKVTAVSSNPSLFSDLSVTYTDPEPSGLLSFKPAPNANGIATITVSVNDGAELNHTTTRTFSVSVAPINNAPSFVFGSDLFVAHDAGPQVFPGWAGDITPGPGNEASQSVQFIVTANQPALFKEQPAISPDGTLRFTPAVNGSDTATVQVVIIDNGGTANGGVDSSSPKTFHIAITTNKEESGIYNGLVQAAPSVSPDHQRAGVIRLAVRRGGVFSGVVRIAGSAFPLRGFFDQNGTAHFRNSTGTELVLTKTPRLALTLQLDVAGNTGRLFGTVTENSAPFAVVEADRALYTDDKNPSPPYLHVPETLSGRYTVRFSVNEGDPARHPQGYGIALLNVGSDGIARLAGTLADGTSISCTSALSRNNRWPFYAAFARGTGSISGYVQFQDIPAVSDLDGDNLHWFRPARSGAKRYPMGWAEGLKTELIGSKFVTPPSARSEQNADFPLLDTAATLTLAGAGLPEGGLSKAIDISPRNVVSVVTPGADRLALSFGRTGYFSGSFLYPDTQQPIRFRGVVLQKQETDSGFFLGSDQAGAVTMEATP
ncbi:MAG: Ig-like domain-containing protein, partial [Verrucomicrobiota bacterium]